MANRDVILGGQCVTVAGDVKDISVVLHHTVKGEPEVRIKLMKMSKSYQWEISAEGPDPGAVLLRLENVDKELRLKYGSDE